MNITIDCRFLNTSGIGVYLRECLPYFLDSPHSFVLLGETERLRPLVKDHRNSELIACTVKPFSIAELLVFPRHIKKII
ncbi:MAG: hypothetical protein LBH32_05530, partial [Dysgonamonadaceae bacterium]|nr:hypothetical protein [Dysgonamonadaceae bacterium]